MLFKKETTKTYNRESVKETNEKRNQAIFKKENWPSYIDSEKIHYLGKINIRGKMNNYIMIEKNNTTRKAK